MATTSSNPSHILIARSARSPTGPSLSSPTENHTPAMGIFPPPSHPQRHQPRRSVSSPSWANVEDSSASGSGAEDTYEHVHVRRPGVPGERGERSESGADEEGEEVEVDPTFRRDAEWPGTVRINVENTTFWAHKDVLIFASPFFAAALSGNWAETGRPASLSSSIITVTCSSTNSTSTTPAHPSTAAATHLSIPESDPASPDKASPGPFTAELEAEPDLDPDADSESGSDVHPHSHSPAGRRGGAGSPPPQTTLHFLSPSSGARADSDGGSTLPDCSMGASSSDEEGADLSAHRAASLRALSSGPKRCPGDRDKDKDNAKEKEKEKEKEKRHSQTTRPHVRVSWDGRAGQHRRSRTLPRPGSSSIPGSGSASAVAGAGGAGTGTGRGGAEAVIDLMEERAGAFHDFLKFVYPHLECTITWNNVENLMHLSQKLISPNLQSACLSFLLSHAAGKPIKALRIAELYEEDELYREASRFVLDNLGGWPDSELKTLSRETLLKLEKRRTWFLERLLKLGVTPIAKDYTCCSSCPDPTTCARLLEEKWRQGYLSLLRFGPPQPSMVFRYLRQLELSPPLTLTHLSCQTCAKIYISTLFDRMFSLGVRGSGTDTTPLGGRVSVASGISGPRRHFLYCTLRGDREWKPGGGSTKGEVHSR